MHPIFQIKNGIIQNSGKFSKYIQQLNGDYELKIEEVKLQRTVTQNRSLYLYFEQLAQALNDAGYSVNTFYKEGIELPFSQLIVKELIWKEFQTKILGKESTATLTTDEVDKIYRPLRQYLIEHKGVDVPFPSIDNLIDTYDNS